LIGLSQRICHPKSCTPAGALFTDAAAASAAPADINWGSVAAALTRRALRGANAVRVVLDDSAAGRTPGTAVTNLAKLCGQLQLSCVLDLAVNENLDEQSRGTNYFLSPDVLAALHAADSSLVLSIRDQELLREPKAVLSRLRAAGVTQTILASAMAGKRTVADFTSRAKTLFDSDAHRNVVVVAPDAQTALASADAAGNAPIVRPFGGMITGVRLSVAAFGSGLSTSQAAVLDFDQRGGTLAVEYELDSGLVAKPLIRPTPFAVVAKTATCIIVQTGPSTLSRGEVITLQAEGRAPDRFVQITVVASQMPTATPLPPTPPLPAFCGVGGGP
jgi:hypothetical protein